MNEPISAETSLRDSSFVMTGHHCHTCYELFYVSRGECRFLVEDRWHDLHEGEFILVPPLELHYTRYPFGECRRTVVLFRREDLAPEIQQQLPGQEHFLSETHVFRVPAEHRDDVLAAVSSLTEEAGRDDPRSPLLRRLILQALFLHCSRICAVVSNLPSDLRTDNPEMLEAAAYISSHYMNPISTGDVAAAVGFSPNYLSRRFRQTTGIGLHEYLVFVRLRHAARELLSTRDSITEIALRCGFSDGNYFKDSFKKKYGVTPRHYRAMA